MSVVDHEVLTVLTPQLDAFAAWAIYTSSRSALLLFDDCAQLRQALAELMATEGRHLHGLCRAPRFHATGLGKRARAALRRAVELRWADAAIVLRCNGDFSRDSAHRTTDFAVPSYDKIEFLDDHVLLGLNDHHDIFEAFDLSFDRTDFRNAGIEFLGKWCEREEAGHYSVGHHHGGSGVVAYTLESNHVSEVQTLVLHESYVTPIAVTVAEPDGPPSRRTRQSTTNTNVPRERTLLRVCADGAVDVDVQAKGGATGRLRARLACACGSPWGRATAAWACGSSTSTWQRSLLTSSAYAFGACMMMRSRRVPPTTTMKRTPLSQGSASTRPRWCGPAAEE